MYRLALLLAFAALTQAMIPARRPPSTNIVGGGDADVGEFPSQVLVWKTSYGGQWCGGTLIDAKWVLSAAHCFYELRGPDVSDYVFWLGAHHADYPSDDSTAKGITAKSIIIHSDYNPLTSQNDVALIELSEAADLSSPYIKTEAIRTDDPPVGTSVTVTGWGVQNPTTGTSKDKDLQKVDVPVIMNERCAWLYSQYTIDDGMMCAGDVREGGEDACQGDSGGPLHWKDGGVSYLTGVVSWGVGCAQSRNPGVYARVSYYVNWINSITKLSLGV